MADITKIVGKHIPSHMRRQTWSSSELADDATVISSGDIVRVKNSLGRSAKNIKFTIVGASDLAIRVNSRHQVFARQSNTTGVPGIDGNFYDNIAVGGEVVDSSIMSQTIGGAASTSFEMDRVLPVDDIELVAWSSGTWTLDVV